MPEAGNTLTLETTQGQVVIEMRPISPQPMSRTSKSSWARSSTTASFSTA